MRSTLVALSVGLLCLGASSAALAKKPKAAAPAKGETQVEQTLSWEQKVMGDDGGKRADLKKIAAAQRLGDEARKNPPPEPPKKHKDPNKEGARAKNEAAIGLPIASEEKARAKPAAPAPRPAGKKPAPGDSANDELGALVAASLASASKLSSGLKPGMALRIRRGFLCQ